MKLTIHVSNSFGNIGEVKTSSGFRICVVKPWWRKKYTVQIEHPDGTDLIRKDCVLVPGDTFSLDNSVDLKSITRRNLLPEKLVTNLNLRVEEGD